MAMATCVLTCSNWFCMSRITCLIIFSGSSALSIRSFRFARTSLDTRSSSAIMFLLRKLDCRSLGFVLGRLGLLLPDLFHLGEQLGHLHAGEGFKQRGNLGGHSRHISGDLV